MTDHGTVGVAARLDGRALTLQVINRGGFSVDPTRQWIVGTPVPRLHTGPLRMSGESREPRELLRGEVRSLPPEFDALAREGKHVQIEGAGHPGVMVARSRPARMVR